MSETIFMNNLLTPPPQPLFMLYQSHGELRFQAGNTIPLSISTDGTISIHGVQTTTPESVRDALISWVSAQFGPSLPDFAGGSSRSDSMIGRVNLIDMGFYDVNDPLSTGDGHLSIH